MPAPGFARDDVLALAAAVEAESPHPIAVAIRDADAERAPVAGLVGRTGSPCHRDQRATGVGVTGTVDGKVVEVVKLGTSRSPGRHQRRSVAIR